MTFDYLWIKPGLSVKGHALLLRPWDVTEFRVDAKREADEMKNGAKITAGAAGEQSPRVRNTSPVRLAGEAYIWTIGECSPGVARGSVP